MTSQVVNGVVDGILQLVSFIVAVVVDGILQLVSFIVAVVSVIVAVVFSIVVGLAALLLFLSPAISLGYVCDRVGKAKRGSRKITSGGVFGSICIFYYLFLSFLSLCVALYRLRAMDKTLFSNTNVYNIHVFWYVWMAFIVIGDVLVSIPFFRPIPMDWYWALTYGYLWIRWIQLTILFFYHFFMSMSQFE